MNSAELWNLHAQELLGIPGWTWRRSEVVDPPGTFILAGGVYAELYKSGPRKGRINGDRPTPGTERTVVITREARAEFAARWERTSGICSACFGAKGAEVWSLAAKEKRWKECNRCHGTGGVEGVERAAEAAVEAPAQGGLSK